MPLGKLHGQIQQIEKPAGIPICSLQQAPSQFRRKINGDGTKAQDFITQRPLQNVHQIGVIQSLEYINPCSGKQRVDKSETGIFSRGPNQDDNAFFHIGKQGILLGFVETMDLINKKNGVLPLRAGLLGTADGGADFLDPTVNRRKNLKLTPCCARQQLGKGGFTSARWTP